MSVPRLKTPRDPRESQLISSYDSTSGVSPDAPAGGGGPGRFTSRKPHGFASAIPFQSKTGPRAAKESVLVAGQNEPFDEIEKTAKGVIGNVIEIKKRAENVVLAYYLARDKYIWQMVLEETGRSLKELLEGLIPALLTMLIVVAASTVLGATAGAIIGALFGGVGAAPGAAIGAKAGFEFGVFVLTWLGIGFLIVYIGEHLGEVIAHISAGVERAWYAGKRLQPEKTDVEEAAKEMARGIAVLFRLVLEGIVMYLLAKGAAAVAQRLPKLVEALKDSKLGKGFAEWIEKNHKSLIEDPKTNPQLRRSHSEDTPTSVQPSDKARPGAKGEPRVARDRLAELSIDPQTKKVLPKSVEEAEAILEAEKKGFVANARRPDLSKGEPNLDFKVDGGYADVKTPKPHPRNPLSNQAKDIAKKSKLYDDDVKVVVNLKHLDAAQKAQFKADLANESVKQGKIGYVGD